jgi:deoxyribonuclease IV
LEQQLGAHTSINGGVYNAVDLAEKLGFHAMQIFTKNNNRWHAKELSDEEIDTYKARLKTSDIKVVVAHDSYLINLCSKDTELLNKSRESFLDELKRCELLGIPHLNFHPGAHMGLGESEGIKLIAESINIAHSKTEGYKVTSMIETTAGQGSTMGYKFEHLRKIIDLIDEKERVTICIDTAHIFAAGYDIKDSKNYDNVINEFDNIVGIDRLKCLHMNDSKKPLGSKVDRHENIGKGFIGLEGFTNIMNDKRISHIPKILETPKGKEQLEDLANLNILKKLIKK